MSNKTIRHVRRGDIEGNLVRVKQPEFLTLTKRPANQRAFSVIRSDTQGNAMAQNTAPVARRTRTKRADDTKNLAAITFPAGYTAEQVTESLTAFGLSTGYTVTQEGELFRAQRSDLQSIAKDSVTEIKLTADGVTAQILRGDETPAATEGMHGIKLVALEFDIEKFEEDKIPEYLQRNSVDFQDEQIDNSANDKTVLKRSEVEEGTETRRVQLEEGVIAVIARADVNDIPDGFCVAVNELAYGNYGWGQLDFNAAMADVAVSEQLEDGLWKLREVLNNILFWSALPIDSKKALVSRSLTEYSDYVNGLLDLLPRQVLIAVGQTQRSDSGQSQEKAMATKTEANGNPTPQAAASEAAQLSRADVQTMIDEGLKGIPAMVTDAVKAALPAAAAPAGESVQRADGGAAPAADANAAAAAAQAAPVTLTRSDLEEAVKAAVAPIAEKVDALSGTTIVRSDNNDPTVQATQGKDGKVKRSAGEVFKGVIPGLRK